MKFFQSRGWILFAQDHSINVCLHFSFLIQLFVVEENRVFRLDNLRHYIFTAFHESKDPVLKEISFSDVDR